MSPPKFLPNLSTDGQENATFEAKNTNPHALIPKPVFNIKQSQEAHFPSFPRRSYVPIKTLA